MVTAIDYDANWMLSAADDGLVVVYKETPGVSLEVRPWGCMACMDD